MTDTMDSDVNGEGGEPLDPRIREQLRKSKEHQQRAEEAEARAAAAERRSVFAEVGIPTSGTGELFRQAYAGDLTPEAVKAAAEGYGILGSSQEQSHQSQGMTGEERAAAQRIAGAGTGVPPAGSDPRADIANKILQAKDQAEVMALVRELEDAHPEYGRFTQNT